MGTVPLNPEPAYLSVSDVVKQTSGTSRRDKRLGSQEYKFPYILLKLKRKSGWLTIVVHTFRQVSEVN